MRQLNEIQAASYLSCYHGKTQALLRALKAGTLSLDAVTMTDDGWTVAEVEPAEGTEQPPEPPDESE